jgi:hypothetical protein
MLEIAVSFCGRRRATDGPSDIAGTPAAGVTVPVLGISAVLTHGELALSFVQIKTVLSYDK